MTTPTGTHLSWRVLLCSIWLGGALALAGPAAQASAPPSSRGSQYETEPLGACAPDDGEGRAEHGFVSHSLISQLACSAGVADKPHIPPPSKGVLTAVTMTRRQQQLRLWNKIMGATATALLFTTSIIGDKNVLDTFAHRLPSQGLLSAHHGLIIASSIAYLAANILGWLDPMVFRYKASRFWHRVLRWVHTIGFVALIALGIANARLTPGATTGKIVLSVAHMSAGYMTLGALGVGTLLLFF